MISRGGGIRFAAMDGVARPTELALSPAVRRWREETPGCEARVHLNNAGAALQPRAVIDAVEGHLRRETEIGGYEAAEEAAEAVRACYADLGRVLGAAARNVAVVENATVAWAQALSAFDFQPGDRLVTTRVDYPSNQLMYLALAQRRGVEVVRAADRPEGGVDPDSVRDLARHPRCRLVALTWVPTNSGLVQDAHAVGEVCADLGVPYLVDACQATGQLPVDVARLRCDYLAGTARKFLRGPRGIGFLYASDRALERGDYPLHLDMRGAEWTAADDFQLAGGARRFENWEFSYALLLGMGAAARYTLAIGQEGLDRTQALATELRERLAAVPGVQVLDRGRQRCAVVTVAAEGWDATDLKLRLRERSVNTSASRREDGVLDLDDKGVNTVLRLSPHYYNTEAELETAVGVLAELVRGR
jgi:selenocysteine lyase/cysteine desulfurase